MELEKATSMIQEVVFLCLCVKVLWPSQPYVLNIMGSCRARSVHLTTLLLERLSPLSG